MISFGIRMDNTGSDRAYFDRETAILDANPRLAGRLTSVNPLRGDQINVIRLPDSKQALLGVWAHGTNLVHV